MGESQSTRSRATETSSAEPDVQIHETRTWHVRWEIDIEATSAEEAAVQALIIMRDDDPANTAVVFECVDRSGAPQMVDLLEGPDRA